MKAILFTKKGSIKKETENALEWFPELEKLFENFDIEHMSIRMKGKTDKFMLSSEE